MRQMIIAAGPKQARESFCLWYERLRRPYIFGPTGHKWTDRDKWMYRAARQALIHHEGHTLPWDLGREIDCKLIAERDKS